MTKRLIVQKPGRSAVCEIREEPEASLRPGQARVAVRAAGVNFADLMVRLGLYEAATGLYPLTPGFEFSGTVSETAPGSRLSPGERVFGVTRFGGYSSSIPADEGLLWPCPEGWSFEECAAFPAVQLTAYYGLFRCARVVKGETVLVHSAAGGAGSAFVSQAKAAGCRVIAVVGSPAKVERCRALGAHEVLARGPDLWSAIDRAAPQGLDAIFDANGVDTLREGYRRLAPGGRLVVYGFAEIFPRGSAWSWPRMALNYLRVPRFSPLDMTGRNRGVLGFNVVHLFGDGALAREAMSRLLAGAAAGDIPKPPVKAYPFSRVAEAHEALASGRTIGKLVLVPD